MKLGPYALSDWEDTQSVYTGDCRVLGEAVPDESVDLIFTDPPWDLESIDLYMWLAQWSARVLKPGGWLMAYAGSQAIKDYIMACLDNGLTWFRIFGGYQPDSNLKMFPQKVFVQWRPIPVFSKGEAVPDRWVPDMMRTNRDKRYHEWGQGEQAPMRWIDCMVGNNAVVIDPFCGGGTTAAVCRQLENKYCLTFELDSDVALIAQERIRSINPLPMAVQLGLGLAEEETNDVDI